MFQINECQNVAIIQTFSHSNIRTLFKRLFAGDHRGVVTPVPIPNTEVKGPIAEGSAGLARARVGRRRQFFFQKIARRLRRTPPSGPYGLGFAEGDTAFFCLESL